MNCILFATIVWQVRPVLVEIFKYFNSNRNGLFGLIFDLVNLIGFVLGLIDFGGLFSFVDLFAYALVTMFCQKVYGVFNLKGN